MKTHELANGLVRLAKALKQGPDLEVDELFFGDLLPKNFQRPLLDREKQRGNRDDLPVALSALLSLSSFDKQEWMMLINDLGLPIEIRARDASRDLLGKVLSVLEKDPHARARLSNKVKAKSTRASPELMRALSSLLES